MTSVSKSPRLLDPREQDSVEAKTQQQVAKPQQQVEIVDPIDDIPQSNSNPLPPIPSTAIPQKFKICLVFIFLQTATFAFISITIPDLLLSLCDQSPAAASQLKSFIDPIAPALQFLTNNYFGFLSDRIGRKPFLLLSITQLILACLIVGLWPSILTLVIAAVIRGVDCGLTMCNTILADTAHPTQYVTQFGKLGSALAAGVLVGPALAAALSSVPSRVNFLIGAGVAAFNLLIVYRYAHETLGIKTVETGAALENINTNVLPDTHTTEDRTSESTTDCPQPQSAALPEVEEILQVSFPPNRASFSRVACFNPFKPLRILFMNRMVALLSFSWFLHHASVLGLVSVLFLFNYEKFDWGVMENAIFMFSFAFLSVSMQVLVLPRVYMSDSLIARKLGEGGLLAVGLLTQMVYLTGFILTPASVPNLMFALIVAGAPSFCISAILRGSIARYIPQQRQGEFSGALGGLGAIGVIFASATFNQLFSYYAHRDQANYFPEVPFVLALGLVVIASAMLGFTFCSSKRVIAPDTSLGMTTSNAVSNKSSAPELA